MDCVGQLAAVEWLKQTDIWMLSDLDGRCIGGHPLRHLLYVT